MATMSKPSHEREDERRTGVLHPDDTLLERVSAQIAVDPAATLAAHVGELGRSVTLLHEVVRSLFAADAPRRAQQVARRIEGVDQVAFER